MELLNIGAGKMPYLTDLIKDQDRKDMFIVNLDSMYYQNTQVQDIEGWYDQPRSGNQKYYCKEDIFKFLERTRLEFDIVTIYRFLEHVSFTQVLYFIYLVSGVVRKGGIVDIIVPNYEILADMILAEKISSKNFERDNILLTTELLNEPSCPHASIWTPARAIYFWEFEKRFKIENGKLTSQFEYDGRDIYLRFQAVRI